MFLNIPYLKAITIKVLTAWVLLLLTKLEPNAPWKDTYPATAAAFAESAVAHPLFSGEEGPRKTAALYVGVSWYESTFNPKAEGDHRCLEWAPAVAGARPKCRKKGEPTSFCLGQINSSNFAALRVSRESLINGEPDEEGRPGRSGVEVCVSAMNTMLRQSMRNCAHRPLEERLGQYAAGGDGCSTLGFEKSRHRVTKALWLFSHVPLSAELASLDD